MPRVSREQSEIRKDISEACVVLFNEHGMKFTMDDVAKMCHISKKTMYLLYSDKDELFLKMVDFLFDKIKQSEEAVYNDPTLTTIEKIRKILGVMPDGYQELDFAQLYSLKDKYPAIYKEVEARLETGWEKPIALIEQGIKEGVVRPVSIPIVKMMLEASLEQFFQRDVLVRNRISYNKALAEVVSILIDGISEE